MTFNRQQTPVPVAGHPFVVEFIDPGTCFQGPKNLDPQLLYRHNIESNRDFVKRQLQDVFRIAEPGMVIRVDIDAGRQYAINDTRVGLTFEVTVPRKEGGIEITNDQLISVALDFSSSREVFQQLKDEGRMLIATTGISVRFPNQYHG